MLSTTISVGDLVLQDGKAEEVDFLSAGFTHYYTQDGGQHRCADATRIGSTRDGWRIHTGSERPADVGAEDRVEVFMDWHTCSEDVNSKYCAHSWGWGKGCGIVAYRIVSRAKPPISGQGENCGATISEVERLESVIESMALVDTNRDLELRVVAKSMRGEAKIMDCDPEGLGRMSSIVRAWADRISPREPEPPKVVPPNRYRKTRHDLFYGNDLFSDETVAHMNEVAAEGWRLIQNSGRTMTYSDGSAWHIDFIWERIP